MRKSPAYALAALLVLAASLFASAAARADVTLGVVMSMTGPVSSLGQPYMKGFAAAAAGTPMIAGQKVRVISIDDQSDPSAGARAARKLIEEEHVDVLVGSAGTPVSNAVYSVAAEAGVPMVYTANGAIAGERGAWEVSIPQPMPLVLSAVAQHMKAAGIRSVAFIGFNDAFSDTVLAGLKQNTDPLGIRIVTDERYARNDASVTPQILKMMARRPDAMFTGGSGAPGALPHLALAERGWQGPVYSSHAIINTEFLRLAARAADGVIAPAGPLVVADQLPPGNPLRDAAATFRRLYEQANGDTAINPFAGYAYDSFLVAFDALGRTLATGATPGTPAFRTALRDALVSTRNVVGVQAIYNFRPGERFGVDEQSRVLVTLQNGAWKLRQ
ncbi:ABC transporter substrate-binding protein [Rhodovastum atsumiense]|uniref:ABC transporter substrate-binding protein n=1 Tax=Rhodovastum atsumiense TaxID=504468 RepID=A0A5M6IPY3_9PROT|nr:ABC transporter substrate-binding protein [Rhodovastum atsumiense]KAA5610334.1 ABC transporter substrate-binding protein [Rhodovastum atsumiense]CAH2600926.1 ABC transporter substrate-binding protein [Rhodovastum atsumiense]